MKFSSLNPSTRFACSLVCSAVLCFSSVRATADLTNDVSNIDQNVEDIESYFQTLMANKGYLAAIRLILGRALFDQYSINQAPSENLGYLRQIYYMITSDALLQEQLYAATTNILSDTDSINFAASFYLPYLYDLNVSFNLLADEYFNGTWSDAWNVHLSDETLQMYDFVLSNNLDWVQRQIGYYVGNELHVDLSPITDILNSFQSQQYNIEENATMEGHDMAGTVDQWVETGDANDSDTQSGAEDDMRDTDEPEMDDYQVASSTSDTYDVDKDDLLDNLPDDNLSHSPIITLIDAAHFFRATGVRGDMEFNMNHGNFGSFVADLSAISRSAWRGLLAVFSALLFWRKQNEISAIVRGTNFSRVD